jgi:hypothetical protein
MYLPNKIERNLKKIKMSKTEKVVAVSLGACFACVPLYIFELVNTTIIYIVFGVALTSMALLATGLMGKIFNKKK